MSGWQPRRDNAPQIVLVEPSGALARHDEPHEPDVVSALPLRDDGGIGDAVAPAQRCFDFTGIHPYAAYLELAIVAATRLGQAIGVDAKQIARAKDAQRGIRRIPLEWTFREPPVLPKAKRKIAAPDNQFADARGYRAAILRDQGEIDARCREAARNARPIAPSRLCEPLECGRRFRRAIAHQDVTRWRKRGAKHREVRFVCRVASKTHDAEAGRDSPCVRAAEQRAQDGRYGIIYGYVLVADDILHPADARSFQVHDAQGRAIQQGRECIADARNRAG